MKPVFFCLLLVIKYYSTTAQHCGTVLDSESKEPVQYTTIGYLNKPFGTYANDKGEFCIELQNISEKDSILFSGLGYKPLKISVLDFSKQNTFYLEEQITVLNEVVVKKRDYKTIQVGNFNKKTIFSTESGFGPNGNSLLATKIQKPNEIEQGLISKIQYRLETERGRFISVKRFRMRCRIFADLDGKPGKDILTENVVIDLDPKQNMLEVDISKYNLPFDKTYLWLAIETLGYVNENGVFIANQDKQLGKHIPKKANSKKMIVDSLSPIFPRNKAGLQSLTTYSSKTTKWLPLYIPEPDKNFLFGLTLEY